MKITGYTFTHTDGRKCWLVASTVDHLGGWFFGEWMDACDRGHAA